MSVSDSELLLTSVHLRDKTAFLGRFLDFFLSCCPFPQAQMPLCLAQVDPLLTLRWRTSLRGLKGAPPPRPAGPSATTHRRKASGTRGESPGQGRSAGFSTATAPETRSRAPKWRSRYPDSNTAGSERSDWKDPHPGSPPTLGGLHDQEQPRPEAEPHPRLCQRRLPNVFSSFFLPVLFLCSLL